jgi:hypothetical protein
VDKATMQTLAVRGESALAGGPASSSGEIAFAVFPPQALFPALLDAPARIVVLWVVCAPLPVHLAL